MHNIKRVNNLVNRFKSLPISSKRLISLGAVLGLFVALPLFIWAIVTQTFLINQKAASGEPPTPTPFPTAIPTCMPRPKCLDSVPRCLIPEPIDGWCTATPTPSPIAQCGTDGSPCNVTYCPVCKPGQVCPMIACVVRPGTCLSNKCVPIPTPTPTDIPVSYVKVLSPNGGETLTVGQTFTITWQGDGHHSYLIYLVNSLGEISLINGADASTNTYNWVVNSPIMANTAYHKIEVIENGPDAAFDISNGYFKIINPNQGPTPTPSNYCSGPNGSNCTVVSCPICSGRICPLYPCTARPGTCFNHTCVPGPTSSPKPTPSPTSTSTPTPTATPSPTPTSVVSPTPIALTGDVNHDGKVNIIDIGIVIDNYRMNPPNNPDADINHDGLVNIIDIGIIVDNYQF